MAPSITPEHPASPDATALIAELDAHLGALYAVESRHGFSIQKLIAESVAFFAIRENGASAGCGGIKLFGTESSSMSSTSPASRRARAHVAASATCRRAARFFPA